MRFTRGSRSRAAGLGYVPKLGRTEWSAGTTPQSSGILGPPHQLSVYWLCNKRGFCYPVNNPGKCSAFITLQLDQFLGGQVTFSIALSYSFPQFWDVACLGGVASSVLYIAVKSSSATLIYCNGSLLTTAPKKSCTHSSSLLLSLSCISPRATRSARVRFKLRSKILTNGTSIIFGL